MSTTSKGFASALQSAPATGHARIAGIGGYRPRRVVPNSELVEAINSSDEWIRERSGIIERRFAGEGESVIDMSVMAAEPALEMAGLKGSDIDAILVATISWPYQTPAAAPLIAERFGTDAMAIDLSAACAGYCHGIALANDMVRGGSAENVLVVGVERLSDFTSRDDRGTAFIFGDGAGGRCDQQVRDPGHRPDDLGLGRREVGRHLPDRQLDRRSREGPGLAAHRDAGSDGLPVGGVGHGPGRPARPRRRRVTPTSSTPSSRTRPTCASSTRCSSSSSCPPTSPSPATSPTPATPRRPRCRWRWSAWCATARSPAAGSPCRSASAPAWSYAAQVVVIP
jgi:hypothetical protein